MIQELITYLILLATIIIAALRLYKFFTVKETNGCSNCFQSKSGCKVHIKKFG